MTQKEIYQEMSNLESEWHKLDKEETEVLKRVRAEKRKITTRLNKLESTVGDDIISRRINIADTQLGVGFKFREYGKLMEILKVNKKTFQVRVSPSKGYVYPPKSVILIKKEDFVEQLELCDKNKYNQLIKSYNRERNLDKVLS